jgi:hypothetical protein
MKIATFLAFLTTWLLFPVAALPGDLPKELLLRCDLKQIVFMDFGGKTELHEDKFSKDFRLKDAQFGWAGSRIPIGTNCQLVDGEIACEWRGVIPPEKDSPLGSTTEKRHSSVRLSRSTGEIVVMLETWGYAGNEAKGKPRNSMRLSQRGVCRSIGKPLF